MNIYGENGLCALAKLSGKKRHKAEWTADDARREASSYAVFILRQGRRSKSTKRYYTAIMNAFLEGVLEERQEKEQG